MPAPMPTPFEVPSFGLTPRESEVLQLVAQGYSNRRIAEELLHLTEDYEHSTSPAFSPNPRCLSRTEAAAIAHRFRLASSLMIGAGRALLGNFSRAVAAAARGSGLGPPAEDRNSSRCRAVRALRRSVAPGRFRLRRYGEEHEHAACPYVFPKLDRFPIGFWWLWGSTLVNRLATFVYPFLKGST